MRAYLAGAFLFSVLASPLAAMAQAEGSGDQKLLSMYGTLPLSMPEGLSSCFSHYRFGSTPVSMSLALHDATPGSAVPFTGEVRNENDYPVSGVTVFAKVMRLSGPEKSANGPDVVDWLPLAEQLSLPASGSTAFSGAWQVPAGAQNGEYAIATYVVSEERFNFDGLSFMDDIVGSRAQFSVMGGASSTPGFSRDGITAAGFPFSFAAFPPHLDPDAPISVTAEIDNPTASPFESQITWKLYSWDAVTEAHLIDSSTQAVKVHPMASTTVSYATDDRTHGVYYLMGTLDLGAAGKSIIGIRMVRDGVAVPRFNFVGIDPAEDGTRTAVACVHSTGGMPAEDSQVDITILRTGFVGRIMNLFGPMATASFTGALPPDIYALTAAIPDSSPVVMTAVLSQHGEEIDRFTVSECTTGNCEGWGGMPLHWVGMGVGAILAIFLLLAFIARMRASRRPPPPAYAPPAI